MAQLQFNFRSKVLRGATNVTIILPTDMFKADAPSVYVPGVKYQTLWLLHGGMDDNMAFMNYSSIARYAEEARTAVVMPSCPGKFFQEPYYEYITEELPKVLRVMLPLSDRREDNFIGGLSHGGDAALKAVLEHPDRYAAALIMSAAGTTHSHDPNETHFTLHYDVYGMAEKNLASGQPLPMMFFATGSGDRGFPAYVPVIDRLDAMGMPLQRIYVNDDGHSWPFWDHRLQEALDHLLPLRHEVIFPEN